MKPSDYYTADVASGKVVANPLQERALQYLDDLYSTLTPKASAGVTLGQKFKAFFSARTPARSQPKGLYLWGSVGRGKTYLMDLFYKSISGPKLRQHFYEFMAGIHVDLKLHQGKVNPLKLVADDIAKIARVLCFDEFFVEDIADAMILGSLLHYLIENNVVIITTSNCAPDDLYHDGLQRDRFLPAIEIIKAKMMVMHLDHEQDYRLSKELRDHRYHFPLENSQIFLDAHFDFFNEEQALLANHFELNERSLCTVKRGEYVIWFEFTEICASARSSLDYLKLCKTYKAILVAHLPPFDGNNEDACRRFITLVDTCYDAHVLLILTAAVSLENLYQGTLLEFEFERVKSRIIEMQSWA